MLITQRPALAEEVVDEFGAAVDGALVARGTLTGTNVKVVGDAGADGLVS
ncbi:hypothetical protein [Streptomyces sp. NPDC101234]